MRSDSSGCENSVTNHEPFPEAGASKGTGPPFSIPCGTFNRPPTRGGSRRVGVTKFGWSPPALLIAPTTRGCDQNPVRKSRPEGGIHPAGTSLPSNASCFITRACRSEVPADWSTGRSRSDRNFTRFPSHPPPVARPLFPRLCGARSVACGQFPSSTPICYGYQLQVPTLRSGADR
jgi:hypothetical protein